jgi:hypothetical protein
MNTERMKVRAMSATTLDRLQHSALLIVNDDKISFLLELVFISLLDALSPLERPGQKLQLLPWPFEGRKSVSVQIVMAANFSPNFWDHDKSGLSLR